MLRLPRSERFESQAARIRRPGEHLAPGEAPCLTDPDAARLHSRKHLSLAGRLLKASRPGSKLPRRLPRPMQGDAVAAGVKKFRFGRPREALRRPQRRGQWGS